MNRANALLLSTSLLAAACVSEGGQPPEALPRPTTSEANADNGLGAFSDGIPLEEKHKAYALDVWGVPDSALTETGRAALRTEVLMVEIISDVRSDIANGDPTSAAIAEGACLIGSGPEGLTVVNNPLVSVHNFGEEEALGQERAALAYFSRPLSLDVNRPTDDIILIDFAAFAMYVTDSGQEIITHDLLLQTWEYPGGESAIPSGDEAVSLQDRSAGVSVNIQPTELAGPIALSVDEEHPGVSHVINVDNGDILATTYFYEPGTGASAEELCDPLRSSNHALIESLRRPRTQSLDTDDVTV